MELHIDTQNYGTYDLNSEYIKRSLDSLREYIVNSLNFQKKICFLLFRLKL